MAAGYTEIPKNYDDAEPFLESDLNHILRIVFSSRTLFFYDCCAFRIHSNLSERGMGKLAEFFKRQGGRVILTRCVLMELASESGMINEAYIGYLRFLSDAGIPAILLEEEHLFDILSECFSTNAAVNGYLTWAVRMSRFPTSTITRTLNGDTRLSEEVLGGKHASRSDIYRHFFVAVRSQKAHSDNLGEELIGICVHILSHLPGTRDGKLCVVTDDKGAAGKINTLMKRTNAQYRGAKIILFSTPKLVQYMYQEDMGLTEDVMTEILSQGTSGNVVVMGTTAYDLAVDSRISMSAGELARKIMEPNGISIVF